MDDDSARLHKQLRKAGLSKAAIDAAWPTWWRDELAGSPSGRTELRFALARNLGVEPKPLLGERVEFIWTESSRFKHLTTQNAQQRAVLSSFGVSVGRLALRGIAPGRGFDGLSATELRAAILRTGQGYVDLRNLLAVCWSLGVPVVQLTVFPLQAQSMHAMVVQANGRHAIILSHNSRYPAAVAFTLAHEIGHIVAGHLSNSNALVDLQDPALARERDTEEQQADSFALSILTGSANPTITTNMKDYNAPSLAKAALTTGPRLAIEPGTLALCAAYQHHNWPVAMSALKFIYREAKPTSVEINKVAEQYLDWDAIGPEGETFLRKLMTI